MLLDSLQFPCHFWRYESVRDKQVTADGKAEKPVKRYRDTKDKGYRDAEERHRRCGLLLHIAEKAFGSALFKFSVERLSVQTEHLGNTRLIAARTSEGLSDIEMFKLT